MKKKVDVVLLQSLDGRVPLAASMFDLRSDVHDQPVICMDR